jgi:hypothetical protein
MSQYRSASVAAPVEAKVKAAGIATYLGLAALLGVLNAATDINLVSGLPDVIEVFVAPMIPTAITTVTAYMTRHTPRPDLGQS